MSVIYVDFKGRDSCPYEYEDEVNIDPLESGPFIYPVNNTMCFDALEPQKEYYDLTQDVDLEIKSLERAMKYIQHRLERLLCRI